MGPAVDLASPLCRAEVVAIDEGSWAPAELARLTGPTPHRVNAYLKGASWPFESVATTVGAYIDHVRTGDVERLRRLLPTTTAPDGAVLGYDPSLDIGFYGALMVDHLDRCVQSDTAALATQVANGRSVDDAVMRIYLSRLGSTSGLHWDGRPASLLQLDGVKEGILLPPSAADRIDPFPNVDGPNSQLDPFAGTADLEDLDARQFVLCPGDALEMPIGWWHCFRAVTETSTSLSIMWRDR